jgi:hypothetical protein
MADEPIRRRRGRFPAGAVLGVLLLCPPAARAADKIVMVDGTTLRGKVLSEDSGSVSIRTFRGMQITLPLGRVHAITTRAGTRELNPIVRPKPVAASPRPAPKPAAARSEPKPGRRGGRAGEIEGATPVVSWPETAKAPGYAQAKAHDPHFENKRLWPLTGKEYFLAQEWPEARLLVWAHPGKDAGQKRDLDGLDPRNWIDAGTGRPAESLPDETTDVLLPTAPRKYTVNWRHPGHGHRPTRLTCRHLTIEPNAFGKFGGDGQGMHFHGNIWVKRGGNLYCQGSCNILGPRHTFFRNDNLAVELHGQDWEMIQSGQYFGFGKESNDATVEFLGHVGTKDEFKVYKGTVIVGIDTRLQPGYGCHPFIRGGRLALMDGAVWEKRTNDFGTPCLFAYKQSVITGGLPDRPLTRSCSLGIGFENHTKAQYSGWGEEKRRESARVPGLVVEDGSVIRTYSKDVRSAHLIVTRMWNEEICPEEGSPRYKKNVERHPELVQRYRWERALPRGIDCWIGKDVTVDGVEFDHFRKGGMMMANVSERARWRNVLFGENNKAEPEELFSELDRLQKNARY